MTQFVLGIGIIIIVAILLVLFRVQTLLSVAKGSDRKEGGGLNQTNGILFILFLIVGFGLFFWYSTVYYDEYTLPIASEHGKETDNLFWITMWVTGIVFFLTHVLLFTFPWRFRFNKNNKALFYPENNRLEMLWTIIPAIVLAVLVYNGWRTWSDIMAKAPEDAEVIEIIGYQYAFQSRYPGKDGQLGKQNYKLIDPATGNNFGLDFTDEQAFDDFLPTEVHIPKGVPVEFKIRAHDVIHSVYVPEFRLQMNAVPGMTTRFWFEATKTTEEMRVETGDNEFDYYIVCNKICGRAHFSMRHRIVVDEPEDYYAWKEEQKSLLSTNPDLLGEIPSELKELALIKSGIKEDTSTK